MASPLAALALLKTNWDFNHDDFIDNLIPHFATAIVRQSITSLNAERMARAFRTEWGWRVPVYVMESLVGRAVSLGLLRKTELFEFMPNRDTVAKYDYSAAGTAAQAQVRALADAYAVYCRERGGEKVEAAEIEKALVAYLAQYDIEIISGSRTGGLLDVEVARGPELYSVGDFLLKCYSDRRDLFEIARQLALAQVFASTLTVRDLESYEGSIADLHVYLDTRVILQTLGIYGSDRKVWVQEFLTYLSDQGAQLRVFDHTYSETETILENCKPYVESGRYNASYASHACRYFRDSGASESDVEEFVLAMRPTLEGLGVEYFEGAYDSSDNEFQLEEVALQAAIEATYREANGSPNRVLNEDTVRKDVRSIALVHRMRQGARPQRLSEAQHVLVTANSSLARASYQLELEQSGGGVVVPDAVRDVFLATLAWLQAPSGFEVMDTSRFLADCHAAIGVDDVLITRFLAKVDLLRERGDISDEAYYELRMHRYALRVLGDVTLGDLDNITDNTPLEVLARLEDRIQWEAEQKLRAEQDAHSSSVASLQADIEAGAKRERDAEARISELDEEVAATKSQQEQLVDTISGWIASALAWPLLIIVVVLGVVAYFGDFFPGSPTLEAVQRASAFVLLAVGLLSFANGCNIAGVRNWLKRKIGSALSKTTKGK